MKQFTKSRSTPQKKPIVRNATRKLTTKTKHNNNNNNNKIKKQTRRTPSSFLSTIHHITHKNFGTDGKMFSFHPPGAPEEGEVFKQITAKILNNPDIKNRYFFELRNESDQHSGPRFRESHFKLTLVADLPDNCKMLLSKHRFVNKILEEEVQQIHALSLHIYTKDQWVSQFGEIVPESPLCASAAAKRVGQQEVDV